MKFGARCEAAFISEGNILCEGGGNWPHITQQPCRAGANGAGTTRETHVLHKLTKCKKSGRVRGGQQADPPVQLYTWVRRGAMLFARSAKMRSQAAAPMLPS